MKPIHLNLAARPYRDYRPVYAVVVAISLATAFLMLNNVDTYYRYIRDTKSTRAETANIEEQTREEVRKKEAAQQRLAALDLQRLDRQAKFVNEQLAQRAFSWSTLLDELESVIPDDVRLTSVTPSFDAGGQIRLVLQFQSKSSSGLVDTIDRLNADPQFRDPFPGHDSENEGLYSFDLVTEFIPPPLNGSGIVTTKATAAKREARR